MAQSASDSTCTVLTKCSLNAFNIAIFFLNIASTSFTQKYPRNHKMFIFHKLEYNTKNNIIKFTYLYSIIYVKLLHANIYLVIILK